MMAIEERDWSDLFVTGKRWGVRVTRVKEMGVFISYLVGD